MAFQKLDPAIVAADIRRRVESLPLDQAGQSRATAVMAALIVSHAQQSAGFDEAMCAALGLQICDSPMGGWHLEPIPR